MMVGIFLFWLLRGAIMAAFNFFSGNPSLDLINTEEMKRKKRYDSFAVEADFVHWLQSLIAMDVFLPEQFPGNLEQQAEGILPAIKSFRARLRALLEQALADGTPSPDGIASLEQTIQAAPLTYKFAGDRLIPVPMGDLKASVLTLVAIDALNLCTGDRLKELHHCSNPKCIWLYLDSTGKRKWCSMKLCGNRAKASNFKLRSEKASEVEPG